MGQTYESIPGRAIHTNALPGGYAEGHGTEDDPANYSRTPTTHVRQPMVKG
jgi:hypothetical protein